MTKWLRCVTGTPSQFSECESYSDKTKVHYSEKEPHLSCTSYSFCRWLSSISCFYIQAQQHIIPSKISLGKRKQYYIYQES